MPNRTAIYPGSFDPVTYGHIDVVERGLKIFDKIIIVVAKGSTKKSLFSVEARIDMLRKAFSDNKNVEVDHWDGLLVKYAHEKKADAILRGLRAFSDFENEFQMATMNKHLYSKVDTYFVMTSEKYHYVSSQLVREVAGLGGSLDGIVPSFVEDRLAMTLKENK
jgi:pantetheine-phosphate adenylyltransferase